MKKTPIVKFHSLIYRLMFFLFSWVVFSAFSAGFNPALAARGGALILETVPNGATVLIDFQEKGKTPIKIENIPQGKHILTIHLKNYHRVEKHLQIYTGQTIKQRHVLHHLIAFLYVDTEPEGAGVHIHSKALLSKDNEFNESLAASFLGITPLFRPNIVIGHYTLEVEKEGYQVYKEDFELVYGQEKRFKIKLKGLPGKLRVTTKPDKAKVMIKGRRIGVTNFTKKVNSGKYILEITKPGYLETKLAITVEPDKTTKINLELHKTDIGKVHIKTEPRGVKVYLNSHLKGTTPLKLKNIAEGEYRLSLEKDGYYTIDKMIRVRGGEVARFDEKMQRQVATVDITSEPSGANIRLDNNPIGRTPLTLSTLPVGTHTLRADLPGYVDYLKHFYVYERQYLRLHANMDPLPGHLRISSVPSGASVTVNNFVIGTTPGDFELNADKYRLRVTLPGYQTYIKQLVMPPDKTISLNIDFRSVKTGSLSVQTVPKGASLFLDGQKRGETPLNIERVEVGKYHLRISHPRYDDYRTTLHIREGRSVRISEKLDSLTGQLEVTTKPEGTTIYLDGRKRGKAPHKMRKIPVGKHELRLSHYGYADKVMSIEIYHQEITKVQERLMERSSTLTVMTIPTRAKVYVDSKFSGYSGSAIEISPGLHIVKVEKDGYKTVQKKIAADKGEAKTWRLDLKAVKSGNLVVSSIPPGSEVYLDGVYRGLTPLPLNDIPSKRYRLKLARPGFASLEKEIYLVAGQTVDVLEELHPATGGLFVQVQPMGSKIYLDGESVGISPLYLDRVMAGRHKIRIEDSRYKGMEVEIEVLANQENRFEYDLKQIPSQVFIFSDPSDADIFVNGEKMGKTNRTLNLKPGTYEITVYKFGFTQYTKTVNVPVGRKIDLDFQLHKISMGSIYVTSTPLKGEVFLNGEYRGLTPLRIDNLQVASYEILISKDGYQSYRENFNLEKGKTLAIHKNLKTLWALLHVKSKPYGAKVFLDNKYIGLTPVDRYRVSVGWHKIRVKISGYEEWTDEFTIKPGDERVIKVRLKVLDRSSQGNKGSSSRKRMTRAPASSKIVLHPVPAEESLWKGDFSEYDSALSSGLKSVYVPKAKRTFKPMTLDDYQPWKEIDYPVVGYPGRKILADAGELFINSRPPGVDVYLDQQPLGTTPLHVENIPPGSHQLELVKKNFHRLYKTLSLKKNRLYD